MTGSIIFGNQQPRGRWFWLNNGQPLGSFGLEHMNDQEALVRGRRTRKKWRLLSGVFREDEF